MDSVARRDAYAEAADAFLAVASRVRATDWDRSALGEWTVRDLVGHTSRALTGVAEYLGRPARTRDLPGPVEYYLAAAASSPDAIARRGRAAAAALGADPVRLLIAARDRVLALVDHTPDDALLACPFGGIRLIDYMPTRTFELVVHTRDLTTALDIPPPNAATSLRATIELAVDLAVRRGSGDTVLFALTGRERLPEGFTVL